MEIINTYQGKVYALKSHQTPNIYVGSTTGSISTRLICHRSSHKLYKNTKHLSSFELLQHNDCYIEIIEELPNCTKEQLKKREGYWMKQMHSINSVVAGQSKKEWTTLNRASVSTKNKEYYNNNKEKISLRAKTKVLCICGTSYTKANKCVHDKTENHIFYMQ